MSGARFVAREPALNGLVRALLLVLMLGGCATVQPPPGSRAGAPEVQLGGVPLYPQRTDHCGPAALAMVLGWSGLTLTPDELAPGLFIPQRAGTLQTEIIAQTRAQGRLPWRLEGTFEALLKELQAGHPVLVMQNLALSWWPRWHYAVVVGYRPDSDTVLLHAGGKQRQEMTLRRFLRSWQRADRWAMLALPPERVPASAQALGFLRAVHNLETARGANTALPYYQSATRQWPLRPEAHLALANAYHHAGDDETASKVLHQALADGLRDDRIYNNLAWFLKALGRVNDAKAVTERAAAVKPSP